MDKWEFHSSPHMFFFFFYWLRRVRSESPGEETETEVSVTALWRGSVLLWWRVKDVAAAPALLYQRIEMRTQTFKMESQRNMMVHKKNKFIPSVWTEELEQQKRKML